MIYTLLNRLRFTLRIIIASLLAGIIITLGPVHPALAATLTVDTTTDEDTANATCSLREAIIAANTDADYNGCAGVAYGADSITLPAGTYTLTLGSELLITSDITINGAGSVSTIVEASTCNPITLPGACTPATYRVLRINSGTIVLNDITIRHGRCVGACTAGAPEDDRGGGIQNYAILTLNNSVVTANFATDAGGGIMNQGPATLVVNSSQVSVNFSGSGAGIHNNDGGSVTIDNSQVNSNTSNFRAAGVRNTGAGSSVIIQNNSQVNNNGLTGGGGGGGITNNAGSVQIMSGSTVSGNTVTGSSGGGIFNFGAGQITIDNATLSGNSTNFDGGAILNTEVGSVVTIQSGTVIGGTTANTAGAAGGGVINYTGTVTVTGSTVSNNSATVTGGGLGVANAGGLLNVTNSNITGNQTSGDGGGVTIFPSAVLNMTGGTMANNTSADVGGGLASNGTATINSTVIDNNTSGSWGGGLYFNGGVLNLTGASVTNNDAVNGGGMYLDGAAFSGTISNSLIRGNIVTNTGGGIGKGNGTLTVTGSRIRSNTAITQGGGVYHNAGSTSVTGSCIMGNTVTAVFNNTGVSQTFTGNWWGAANGPGPTGPGSGDTTSANIDFTGFLTASPFTDCALPPVPIVGSGPGPCPATIDVRVEPEVVVEAGETVVWPISIKNPGPDKCYGLILTGNMPIEFSILSITLSQGIDKTQGNDIKVELGDLDAGSTTNVTITTMFNGQAAPLALVNAGSAAQTQSTFCMTGMIISGQDTACVSLFPEELPGTGGRPVNPISGWVLVSGVLGIIALAAFVIRKQWLTQMSG